ncbi:MAG TPA: ATP-binding cassette domain-containing protein [Vicinamibacteria bacterium]|nr:ATP-binding cassette domain-containing protein [Vicinamibacteria bacterium]
MIELENVTKSFGQVRALRGVSFTAKNGEITGLLGPNGAGKTTALRILYTVIRQDAGTARVDGYDTLTSRLEVQRRIGVLPDAHGLYPRLTARENIRYFGALHRLHRAELESRIDELVDLLDMEDIVERRAEGFSTGQRVKVAIARALVQKPRNVLLDEPTSGLDVPSTRAMRDFIKRLRAEGVCVLLSSHIMQEVSALCDHIVVISKGKVVASGTALELRQSTGEANLEDAFVASIGSEEGLLR